jgi:hypothetical protein
MEAGGAFRALEPEHPEKLPGGEPGGEACSKGGPLRTRLGGGREKVGVVNDVDYIN